MQIVLLWALCWSALTALTLSTQAEAATKRPPNIIIILTDDQGYADVGVFGAKGFKTPNLDRLASEGRRFTDAHSASVLVSNYHDSSMAGPAAAGDGR